MRSHDTRISIPMAQRTAARLGCATSFALVDDMRSDTMRTLWLASQESLHVYKLREKLGVGRIGDELNDPFGLVYLQACELDVQWFVVRRGGYEDAIEIQDITGRVIVERIRSLREKYCKGGPMSEKDLSLMTETSVIWITVHNTAGHEVASTPVKITKRTDENTDTGVMKSTLFRLQNCDTPNQALNYVYKDPMANHAVTDSGTMKIWHAQKREDV